MGRDSPLEWHDGFELIPRRPPISSPSATGPSELRLAARERLGKAALGKRFSDMDDRTVVPSDLACSFSGASRARASSPSATGLPHGAKRDAALDPRATVAAPKAVIVKGGCLMLRAPGPQRRPSDGFFLCKALVCDDRFLLAQHVTSLRAARCRDPLG